MNLSTHYDIQSFVPRDVFERFGMKSVWFIDKRIVRLAEWCYDEIGMAVINDWASGGHHDSRGFRPCSDTEGATFSQHRYGRAVDLVFPHLPSYDRIRQVIIANFKYLNETYGLTTMEADTPSWLHLDLRLTLQEDLLIVPYK